MPPQDEVDREPTSGDLAAAAPPWGRGSIAVRMGTFEVVLRGLDARLLDIAGRQYDGFLGGGAAEGAVERSTVDVQRSPEPHYLYLKRGRGRAEEARVSTRGRAGALDTWSYFYAGRFDRGARAGRLLLCDANELDTCQAIENYLRFFTATAALRRGGFLLHSSGVVRDGRAHLFFGPSGAGKSTAVANSPPDWPRLGDDLVLVESDGRAHHACGVPFRGSFVGLGPNSAVRAPVALACRLFQATENRLERVSPIIQAAELLGEMPFLMDDPGVRSIAAARAEAFVRSVVVRRLHLRNDGSFWDLLTAMPDAASSSSA